MKTTLTLVILASFLAVSLCQIQAGEFWQGTWTSNKRSNVPGNLYICVDGTHNVAYGTYQNIGFLEGQLYGNTFYGEWFEAGYEQPLGLFSLTLSGNSYSGVWNYTANTAYTSTRTFSWSGTRISNKPPTTTQCLSKARGISSFGDYTNDIICPVINGKNYQHTNLDYVSATFENFGAVAGYTPDGGSSLLLSDFYINPEANRTVDGFRPEGNNRVLGSGVPAGGSSLTGPNSINTERIVIGRMVENNVFCAFYWKGLYNEFQGTRCTTKTTVRHAEQYECLDGLGDYVEYEKSPGPVDPYLANYINNRLQYLLNNLMPPTPIITFGPIYVK